MPRQLGHQVLHVQWPASYAPCNPTAMLQVEVWQRQQRYRREAHLSCFATWQLSPWRREAAQLLQGSNVGSCGGDSLRHAMLMLLLLRCVPLLRWRLGCLHVRGGCFGWRC